MAINTTKNDYAVIIMNSDVYSVYSVQYMFNNDLIGQETAKKVWPECKASSKTLTHRLIKCGQQMDRQMDRDSRTDRWTSSIHGPDLLCNLANNKRTFIFCIHIYPEFILYCKLSMKK